MSSSSPQTNFDRTVLVTGGTMNLGYHATVQIARQHPNYQVVIASRSDPNHVADAINKQLNQSNVTFLSLDLSSLDKVRSFASTWESKHFPPIQSLVLNAALQFPGAVEYTDDGYEKTFAISHIGHALLFNLLRPHLADTARVVIVASGTHDPVQKSGMPDAVYNSAEELAHPTPESAKNAGRQRYTSTKLANVLYMYALHDCFTSIAEKHPTKKWTVTATDPGLMPGTGLAREGSAIERFLWIHILPRIIPLLRRLVSANIHTASESGEALARLAVGDDVQGKSGLYFEGLKPISSSKDSYDKTKQEDLWQWTAKTLARDDTEKNAFELRDLL